ncbi:MAG TPA: hypothetical protein VFE47_17035 [Tepidisphaeraceae bacterium]|nr:hypothetical protein [Tepidisphaeraceae bacterium]
MPEVMKIFIAAAEFHGDLFYSDCTDDRWRRSSCLIQRRCGRQCEEAASPQRV